LRIGLGPDGSERPTECRGELFAPGDHFGCRYAERKINFSSPSLAVSSNGRGVGDLICIPCDTGDADGAEGLGDHIGCESLRRDGKRRGLDDLRISRATDRSEAESAESAETELHGCRVVDPEPHSSGCESGESNGDHSGFDVSLIPVLLRELLVLAGVECGDCVLAQRSGFPVEHPLRRPDH
jgi:hypothetical protein